ncbi:ParB/RepB/Spo0J family partition protein [Antarcticimicrobium sediminis]|uniref:Chromosome partitioning protein ParB n=1 Tax=Antarcticimicrobium sediminis TaxID=2546227 RepID=A0A4R5F1F9_9RHOB|nr:ParB N-terminal domain-containing protein [Antarcticimicrobium sediminis]TDE40957.1 chromosome partitioning protein ParB [Antarcticimicrobium sediminis]
MKIINGGNVQRIALDKIEVEGRLRGIREAFVENLLAMAEDTGITTPIHVRKIGARFVLIDGAHRLEVSRRLGLDDIAALVVECRAEEARAMEASNNLGAARMTPLQTAVFVASWKRQYYAMHPERKPGAFKGNQHTGNMVGINLTLTKTIADAFGVSEPTIKRALMAGDHLDPEEVTALEGAPGRITMEDLKALAKIDDAEERTSVISMVASGQAKTLRKAAKVARVTPETAPKDPVEEAFKGLFERWKRAPMAARRRFIEEIGDDLTSMQDGGGEL